MASTFNFEKRQMLYSQHFLKINSTQDLCLLDDFMLSPHIRPSTYEVFRSTQRITMSVIPAELLNALREYNFVGYPLWRMSDGKDFVWVELTFHKNLPTTRLYKKGAESKRHPAPYAGGWPR